MCGRQVVPLAGPAERQVPGHVRLVRDGAIRVALRVRRLAAAVRLDPLADLALAVGLPARLAELDREVAVRRLAVHDSLRAAPARVADVDHVRRANVEADAEAGREDRGRREP